MQNTKSENVFKLFSAKDVSVLTVSYYDQYIRIEVEPDM